MSDNPLVSGFRSMSATRRFIGLGLIAAVVVGIGFVGHWASTPTYVSLYRDLELNEAGAIADRLQKTDIPHKLSAGGTEIMVPVAELARARVALAKDGLPSNGRPGLELFDKPSWGMTDFTQRVTYQRALEGELARTIGGLRGVTRAQVHLVLATPGPLHRQDRPAGASVVLSLKPGTSLAADAVQGITYIVSNSVEDLSPDNVAVMDDAGRVLSVPAGGGSIAGLTTRQLEVQRSVEQHLTGKVEDLLATVVGPGRARAEITADLDFDQVDRTVETYDPDGQVLQNEQRSEGGDETTSGTQTVLNNTYQNSRKLEKNIGSVGKLQRLTVAVLVDDKALPAGGAAGDRTAQMARIEALVRNAVGADSVRGDRISVMAVPFETRAEALASTPAGAAGPKTDVVWIVERFSRPVIALAAIAVLLVIGLRLLSGGAAAPAAPASPSLPPILPVPNGDAALRNRLNGEAPDRPDAMAQVLKSWLAE